MTTSIQSFDSPSYQPLSELVNSMGKQARSRLTKHCERVRYSPMEIQKYLQDNFQKYYLVCEIAEWSLEHQPVSDRVAFMNQKAREAYGLDLEACNRLLSLKITELCDRILDLALADLNNGTMSPLNAIKLLKALLSENSKISEYLTRSAKLEEFSGIALGGAQEAVNLMTAVFRDTPLENSFKDGSEFAMQRLESEIQKRGR